MKIEERASGKVCVLKWKGRDDRFCGKYKDPDTGKWPKIPGGVFPEHVDTREKALEFALVWYEQELAERATRKPDAPVDFSTLCDLFVEEVQARLRGSEGTKDEAETKARFLKASPILGSRPVPEHDEALALRWLRTFAAENISRPGKPDAPRSPFTIRNVAKVLRDIYRFAQRQGWHPRDRVNPAATDEFKAELKHLLEEAANRPDVMFPVADLKKLLDAGKLDELTLLVRAAAFYSGARPGELHGLLVEDYKKHGAGFRYFDITKQWTLPRGKKNSKYGPLKTRWSKRTIPVHPDLEGLIEEWLTKGWERSVGRAPRHADPLFPDSLGRPWREDRAEDFRQQLADSGVPTDVNGEELRPYSIRHTFASTLKEVGVPSDDRDRLLGHRPKDVKALNYEVVSLPALYVEICKLPSVLSRRSGVVDDDDDSGSGGQVLVPALVPPVRDQGRVISASSVISAEEQGFEPWVRLPVRRFSKPLP